MVSAAAELGEPSAQVLALPWDEFLPWWAENWEPGQHVGVVGPTGAGKSTLEVGLCQPRRWVAALDPKGGDDTLAASGWVRVSKWPLPAGIVSDIKEGEPARIIIGRHVSTRADRAANRKLLATAVPALWEQSGRVRDGKRSGGWTIIIDELQLLTDRRFFNLADDVVELLIAARNKGISVVSALQRVAIGQTTGGASATVGDQVYWLAVAYTRDDRMVQRLAELLGRPAAEVRQLIRSLPPFTWCIVGRDPRAPYVLTKPPRVSRSSHTSEAEPGPPAVMWRDRLWRP